MNLKDKRLRHLAATPGPWRWSTEFGELQAGEPGQYNPIVETDGGVYGPREHDARFIAHARVDVPELLEALDASLKALLAIEDPMCTGTVLGEDQYAWPCCGKGRVEGTLWLHAVDCPLDKALTLAGLTTELMRDEARRALGLKVPFRMGDQ